MKDIGSRYNIYGNKWSQKVGWEIFPILIQMAIEGQAPITYGELADKAEEDCSSKLLDTAPVTLLP